MIIDKIENLINYNIVSQKIIDFLKSISMETPQGKYKIDEFSYVNVDVYQTKDLQVCKFEAHRKYIDIQICLSGFERLDIYNTEALAVAEAYDESRDIMFFENPKNTQDSIILQPGKFVLIFPHEAHKPQIRLNNCPDKVKKAVVKIPIKLI